LTRVAIAPVVMAALSKHSFGRLEARDSSEEAYLDTHLTALLSGIAIDPAQGGAYATATSRPRSEP
jgi:hypothetical protein